MNAKLFLISFVLLLFVAACSDKPEPNLELFSPEAFAFDVGEYWEVNSTIYAKGFDYQERDDIFVAKLSYSVDLITAKSDTIFSIFDDWYEEESPEEFVDLSLDAQIEIDSSFTQGLYHLVFNVKDEFSNQTKSISVEFNLSK